MTRRVRNRDITTVRLIDDDPNVRADYRQPVDDMGLQPIENINLIDDLTRFANQFDLNHDAAICDYQLKNRGGYSAFDGDELISHLYDICIPAVLCTRYVGEMPDSVRHRRRRIPVVVRPTDLNEDVLFNAFELTIDEFNGKFTPARRSWRALVRVESYEKVGHQLKLSLCVPGWSSSEALFLNIPDNTDEVVNYIKQECSSGGIARIFGEVNLGTESKGDLYIDKLSRA
jgi:hypothetical protein